jgi:hypothetical protein
MCHGVAGEGDRLATGTVLREGTFQGIPLLTQALARAAYHCVKELQPSADSVVADPGVCCS